MFLSALQVAVSLSGKLSEAKVGAPTLVGNGIEELCGGFLVKFWACGSYQKWLNSGWSFQRDCNVWLGSECHPGLLSYDLCVSSI